MSIERQQRLDRFPKETVLVTGGAGYIGSCTCRLLLKQGYEVIALDQLIYGAAGIQDLLTHPAFKLVIGDIQDRELVHSLAMSSDYIIHLASLVGQPSCKLDPNLTRDVNVTGTRVIARAAAVSPVRRVVFASTCSVYGNQDGHMSEDSPARTAMEPYAESKRLGEQYLQNSEGCYSSRIARLSTVFGLAPRMRYDLVANLFTAQAVREKRFKVIGNDAWRPFVHVWDVARALLMLMEAPDSLADGEVFNIGDNRDNRTIGQIGDLVEGLVHGVEVTRDIENPDARNYFVNFDKIHSRLGFEHSISIERGIQELVHYLSRFDQKINPFDSRFSNILGLKEWLHAGRRKVPAARQSTGHPELQVGS